jgi:DNA-binding CsgD family transcriptional regulator
MHDVVAHHLTVMVTLSEAAAAASAGSPERAAEVMRSVAATGRRALADTRRLLDVLRQRPGDEAAAALAPVPDLTQLDALIEEVRSAGLQTTLEVCGQAPDVPAEVADASGFLLKDAPPADLLTAIRTVAGGEAVLAPTATRRLIDQFVPLLPGPGQQPGRDALLSRLTDREQAVFARLAAGLSNREIAADMHLSQGTVKIHVGRILAKLDLRDRVQAVVLAYESGIIKPGSQ